ncbi:MAG: hypothetical protein AMXMBFR64_19680 [Myxococcales bacterium]
MRVRIALLLLLPGLAVAQTPPEDEELPAFLRERLGDEAPRSPPAPPAEPTGPPVPLPEPQAPEAQAPPGAQAPGTSTPIGDPAPPGPPGPSGPPVDPSLLPPSLYDTQTGAPLKPPHAPDVAPGDQTRPDEPEEPEDRAFELGRLFSSPFIKPSTDVETIAFGIHFQIAPVRAVAKQVLDDYKAQNPDVVPLVDLAQDVDLTALAAASPDQRRELFLAVPGLTADERAAVESFDFAAHQSSLDALISIVSDPEEAITFSLEPWFAVNLDLLTIIATVPLAGFRLGGETNFEVGNVTLDLRFGHHFGDWPAVGFGYGVELALPSGTERADALALTSPLDARRFLHSYLGITPYLVAGVDLEFVLIQTSHQLSILAGVRDDPRPSTSVYYGYSASIIGTPGDIISLSAEFSGIVNVHDALAFGVHAFTGGLRFHFAGVRPGVAVQVPLEAPARGSLAGSGLAYGTVADVNVLIQADFGF